MHTSIDNPGHAGSHGGQDEGVKVYCKIFKDMVPTDVCELRKNTLTNFRWSSCNGCAIGLARYWMAYHQK
jgi:hypothetical protein